MRMWRAFVVREMASRGSATALTLSFCQLDQAIQV